MRREYLRTLSGTIHLCNVLYITAGMHRQALMKRHTAVQLQSELNNLVPL